MKEENKQLILKFKYTNARLYGVLDSNEELQGFVFEGGTLKDLMNDLKIMSFAENFKVKNLATMLLSLLEIYPLRVED